MSEIDLDAQAVMDALIGEADALRDALESRIQRKLTGEILNARSGALADSIVSTLDAAGSAISVTTSSDGVPYAAIQEFGGKTAAYDIVAVKAKALCFGAGGGQVFARRVHHPGSTLPARSYLRSALSETRVQIESGFKEAVLKALGQS
ncbi:hypothetical protein CU048_04535 [Beijerinckiaceae bacterium]|nr:hypothetical protein CU048_04535 [Beijerinckiaceae bacterium]